jgi:guanylate kinase
MPEAVQVFIAPPSLHSLRERLQGRGTDDEAEVARRLQVAEAEIEAKDEFAHVIVNDELSDAEEQLKRLVRDTIAAGGGLD